MIKASVIVIAYNEESYIGECINSLLRQSIKDFELIIVDDCSTDETANIIKSFKDNRIVYVKNIKNYGYSTARNIGINKSKERYIFFIDADCRATKNWLKNGLSVLEEKKVDIITGVTLPESSNHCNIRIRTINFRAGMTCNIGFRKSVLKEAGGFNERYNAGQEDTELSYRLKMLNPDLRQFKCTKMDVYHQAKRLSLNILLSTIKRAKTDVFLVKDYGFKFPSNVLWRICSPDYFFITFLPPYIIYYLYFKKKKKIKSFSDIFYLVCYIPAIYITSILVRINIWWTAIKEHIFVF